MADAYAELFPLQKENVLSFERLVFSLVHDERKSSEARAQLFFALLEPKEQASAATLLQTIESLREGLILTHEDVDYCFTVLLETPRNLRLNALFHSYLDSDLNLDWTLHVWSVIERLKAEARPTDPSAPPIRFVKATKSRFLFSEFARVFPAQKSICESWELEETPLSVQGTFFTGTGTVSLLSFTEALAHEQSKAWIAFHGAVEETFLLETFLKKLNLPYRFFLKEDQNPLPSSSFGDCLARLRQQAPWPMNRRLELNRLFLNSESPKNWDHLVREFTEKQLLTSEEAAFLSELSTPSLSQDPSEVGFKIGIIPFHPISLNEKMLVYCGKSLLIPPRDPFELSPNEAELLFQKGFHVPRSVEHRPRMKQLLDAFLDKTQCKVFSPLPAEFTLRNGQRATRVTQVEVSQEQSNTQVPAPLRPLSATQLETYVQCPTKYFFSHRLKIRPPMTIESAYGLKFGQAAHAALENFFRDESYRSLGDAVSKLNELFIAAMEKEMPFLKDGHPYRTIFLQHFNSIAKKIPELEAKLQDLTKGSRVKSVEQAFELNLDGLAITGKIDRVEKMESSSYLVLDYKTGNVDFSPAHIGRGEDFQALLYLLATEHLYSEKCAGVLFYDLKKAEVKRGWFREELLSPESKKLTTRGHTLKATDFDSLYHQGLSVLRQNAGQMQKGDFSPKPSSTTCGSCDYVSFCRKAANYD